MALGCAPRKKQKVPRKIASAIHKAHVARDKAEKERVEETGVVLPTKRKSSTMTGHDKKKNKKVTRGPDGPNMGIYKPGMLILNSKDPFNESAKKSKKR